MIYFRRQTRSVVDIAACEDARLVAGIERRGFVRCSEAQHRAAWRERDAQWYAARMPRPRIVGVYRRVPPWYSKA